MSLQVRGNHEAEGTLGNNIEKNSCQALRILIQSPVPLNNMCQVGLIYVPKNSHNNDR